MLLTLEKTGMQTISSISIELTTTTSKDDYVVYVTLLRKLLKIAIEFKIEILFAIDQKEKRYII